LAVFVTTVLFYGAHRIRAPAEPVVVVLAAAGAVALYERCRRRSRGGRPQPRSEAIGVDAPLSAATIGAAPSRARDGPMSP
jgi:hypothetical protein